MPSCCPPHPMPWSGASGASARGTSGSLGCGRTPRSVRVWRGLCGVQRQPKAVHNPLPSCILPALDKPGRSPTVSITVDFHDEATYFRLIDDGKAFVECVLAFFLALGFQLLHKTTCRGGGCLTRHSHYARVRLGGITIWRLQCTTCRAVFTVLPHFILRYRQMRPAVARDALLATHG